MDQRDKNRPERYLSTDELTYYSLGADIYNEQIANINWEQDLDSASSLDTVTIVGLVRIMYNDPKFIYLCKGKIWS